MQGSQAAGSAGEFEEIQVTRNQLAVVQSLSVVGILLFVLGVATCFLAYVGAGVVLTGLGIAAMIGALVAWTTLKPSKTADETADSKSR